MVQERLMMKKIESKGNGILVFFRNFEIHYKTLRYDCQIWIVSCFTTNKQKKMKKCPNINHKFVFSFFFHSIWWIKTTRTRWAWKIYSPFDDDPKMKQIFTYRWQQQPNKTVSLTNNQRRKKKRRKKIWNDNDNDAFLIKKKKQARWQAMKKKIQLFFLLPYSFSIHFNNIDDDGDEKGA